MRGALVLAATAALLAPVAAQAAERTVLAPAAAREAREAPGKRTAVFAGGCFWGIEAVFSHVKGVSSAVSGFAGGARGTAQYERVSIGDTGHAEAVKVTYDPAVVRYDQLLRIFFSVATDPTQLNRQGPDTGSQYRGALFPQSEEQRLVGAAYLAQLGASRVWGAPIVTRIETGKPFYAADRYHQDFMLNNPKHGYIVMWDKPKVEALKVRFPGFYKAQFTPG